MLARVCEVAQAGRQGRVVSAEKRAKFSAENAGPVWQLDWGGWLALTFAGLPEVGEQLVLFRLVVVRHLRNEALDVRRVRT